MRHYLQMSKLHSKNNYDRKDADKQKTNEYTKTFCDQAEYQINKKVIDIVHFFFFFDNISVGF